jgi:hypothetical protein
MQATQFTHHPRLPGMGHGFFEYEFSGRRAVGHTGDWRGFSSALLLFPDAGLGLFVAYNREERRLREALMRRFAAQYIGPATTAPPPAAPTVAPPGLAGRYRHRRLAQTTIDKLGALMGFAPERVVTVDDGGALFVDGERFRALAPGLFGGEASGKRVAFRVDAAGAGQRLLEDQSAFDRLSVWETPGVQAAYVGVLALLLLSASLGWPAAAVVARLWPPESPGRGGRAHDDGGWPRLAAGGVAGLILVFLGGVAACLATLDPADIGYGLPPALTGVLTLSFVIVAAQPFLVAQAVMTWRRRRWSLLARLHYTAVVAATLGVIPLMAHWNLLGYRV